MHLRISILIVFSILWLTGCENLKTKRQIEAGTSTGTVEAEPEEEAQQPVEEKIGLILGAGGLKTIAHAGVLQAFEQEKLPVIHIIGLGMASIEGGLYSVSKSASSLQWQMKKWRKDDFSSMGFMSKRMESEKTKRWLSKLIAKKDLAKRTQNFSCPSRSYLSGKTRWVTRSKLGRALNDCASVAPMTRSADQWVAAPTAIELSIKRLYRLGASKIVFVNVLSPKSSLFTKKQMHNNQGDAMYWQHIRDEYAQLPQLLKKYKDLRVINVNVNSQPLLNFRNFNILNIEGLRAAKRFIKQEL